MALIWSEKRISVAFMTTLGRNVGDEFIREGIRNCLNRLDVAVDPYFVDKHDRTSLHNFRDIEVGRLGDKIRDCDLLIQSGAPVYWHFATGSRSTNVEWHQWAWEDRILATPGEPKFLNLGAGSCQPWNDRGDTFVDDPECAEFARRAAERAALTVVRDPVASHMLSRLNIVHHCLPCPAFLAASNFAPAPKSGRLIGVNLMRKAGHFDFSNSFDVLTWVSRAHTMLNGLRKMGRLVFICHDAEEEQFASAFAAGDERIFFANTYREYLDVFPLLSGIFANRVHAAVAAAGFGVPAIIAGTDTRAEIGKWIGIDVVHAPELDPAAMTQRMSELIRGQSEAARLIALRERTMAAYVELLAPIVADIAPRPRPAATYSGKHPAIRLALNGKSPKELIEGLGVIPIWPISESGFHASETYQNSKLRWTDGTATLEFPGELNLISNGLELTLWNIHPGEHKLTLFVNGQEMLSGTLNADAMWSAGCQFTPRQIRRIDIVSDVIVAPAERRKLGLALRQLSLHLAAAGEGHHAGPDPADEPCDGDGTAASPAPAYAGAPEQYPAGRLAQ